MVHFMVLGHEHLISNTNLDFYKLYKPKLQWQLGWLVTILFEYLYVSFLGSNALANRIPMLIAVLILTSVDCKTNPDDKLLSLSH